MNEPQTGHILERTLAMLLLRLTVARREWAVALLTIVGGSAVVLGGGGSGLTNAAICSLVVLASAIQSQFAVDHCASAGVSEMVQALLGSHTGFFRARCRATLLLIALPVGLVTMAGGAQIDSASIWTWLSLFMLNAGSALVGMAIGALAHWLFQWSRVMEVLVSLMMFLGLLVAPPTAALLREFAERPSLAALVVFAAGVSTTAIVGLTQARWSSSFGSRTPDRTQVHP